MICADNDAIKREKIKYALQGIDSMYERIIQ